MWPDPAEDVRCRVTRLFRDMKFPVQAHFVPRSPILDDQGRTVGYLRPISAEPSGFTAADPTLMAGWRNESREAFFTWVESSEEGVRDWLKHHYGNEEDGILLMLETTDSIPFAHFGLMRFDFHDRTCEFARGIRGLGAGGPRGGMTLAGKALFRWARFGLGMERIESEVFSDNESSLTWCDRLGGRIGEEFHLFREEDEGVVRWAKSPRDPGAPPSGRTAVKVEWDLASLDFCR